MGYLLDTNHCSQIIIGNLELLERLKTHREEEIAQELRQELAIAQVEADRAQIFKFSWAMFPLGRSPPLHPYGYSQ